MHQKERFYFAEHPQRSGVQENDVQQSNGGRRTKRKPAVQGGADKLHLPLKQVRHGRNEGTMRGLGLQEHPLRKPQEQWPDFQDESREVHPQPNP